MSSTCFEPDLLGFEHTSLQLNFHVLHQKYVTEGLSIRQIAKDFLLSKETVRQALINAKLPLRKKSYPHGRKSQVKYGEKIIGGKSKDDKKEQKIIQAANQMWEQGLSFRQIAGNLTAMGIKTKCNGKKWHPEMVRRIISTKLA